MGAKIIICPTGSMALHPGDAREHASDRRWLTRERRRLPCDVLARGRSSAGRAPRSQCGGQGFDPPRLHSADPGNTGVLQSRRSHVPRARPSRARLPAVGVLASGTTRYAQQGIRGSPWPTRVPWTRSPRLRVVSAEPSAPCPERSSSSGPTSRSLTASRRTSGLRCVPHGRLDRAVAQNKHRRLLARFATHAPLRPCRDVA
jgi:hypothetical protein